MNLTNLKRVGLRILAVSRRLSSREGALAQQCQTATATDAISE